MSNREQGLAIEIVDERLVISIGIDALMTAVRGGDDWWALDEPTIVDADAFAAEIAHHLEFDEEEDGTTKIHLAIDAAAMAAVESGSDAVRLAGHDE